jgi:transcriptional/translational regulatory protein YebC/TACO1
MEEDGEMTVYTDQKELAKVRTALIEAGLTVKEASLQYVPASEVVVDDPEVARKVLKIMDALDDLDDVVNVHTNADIVVEPTE